MRSFLVAGKLSGVILHVLNRHASLLKHAALLNLKQAALLKIMLRVLVLIMQHALHAYIHFLHIFYRLETAKNTTISIFNTKNIRNLQFPLLITDFNFRLSSGNNNIIL